jgi:hypothetical protein
MRKFLTAALEEGISRSGEDAGTVEMARLPSPNPTRRVFILTKR